MAFWLAPGEKSGPNPAKNRGVLSNHLLTKRIVIGTQDLPHAVQYDVTFRLPVGERHEHAVFEAVTGYMPAEFSRFWRFNPESGKLEELSDGPGEQPLPVILATESGSHAMGCYAPAKLNPDAGPPGYGRFRFAAEKVVKWNCVFRLRDAAGLPARDYTFRQWVVVGDLETVRTSLAKLHREQ
jgi:hypothetical protein